MLIGTTVMVVTPGYATIGLAAPIIITVARLLQGFSVGGELRQRGHLPGRACRRAPRLQRELAMGHDRHDLDHRLAVRPRADLAATHQQLVDWGWRVPYVFGLLVGPAGLYIRSRMAETPENQYRKAAAHADQRAAAPTAGLGPAGARRRRDLEQLLLPAALHSDLRGQDAASARLYHLRRHSGRGHHPRRLLGHCWALFRPTSRVRG